MAPDDIEIRYSEVTLLDEEGRHSEAVTLMKGLVDSTEKKSYTREERAGRVALLERLAVLYRAGEQYKEAIETFQLMPVADPEVGARAAAQVVDTLRQAKEYARAVEEADAACKKYPNDRVLALTRASLLADVGKGAQAAAEVKKLFQGEKDRDSWLALAQVYERSKNYAEMSKSLDAVEQLSTTDEEKATVYFMRGAMHERTKDYPAAETEFRKALAIDADNAAVLNYLGYMLADRGVRLEEALKLIKKAVEAEPTNSAYLDSLGWACYRLDKLEEAETYLRQSLERGARDATVQDHLGDVLAKRGKLKEAVAAWQVSLKEWDASSPSEKDPAEVAKINKKLEGAKVRLAQESKGPSTRP